MYDIDRISVYPAKPYDLPSGKNYISSLLTSSLIVDSEAEMLGQL